MGKHNIKPNDAFNIDEHMKLIPLEYRAGFVVAYLDQAKRGRLLALFNAGNVTNGIGDVTVRSSTRTKGRNGNVRGRAAITRGARKTASAKTIRQANVGANAAPNAVLSKVYNLIVTGHTTRGAIAKTSRLQPKRVQRLLAVLRNQGKVFMFGDKRKAHYATTLKLAEQAYNAAHGLPISRVAPTRTPARSRTATRSTSARAAA